MSGKPGSYSGNPASSDKDATRFLAGDTVKPFVFSDQEVQWAVDTYCVTLLAAAELLENLASQLSRESTKKIGSLSINSSDQADRISRRAKELRRRYLKSGAWTPYVGGLSHDEKDTDSLDTDLVQPHTRVGQDDNPGAKDTDSGYYWAHWRIR